QRDVRDHGGQRDGEVHVSGGRQLSKSIGLIHPQARNEVSDPGHDQANCSDSWEKLWTYPRAALPKENRRLLDLIGDQGQDRNAKSNTDECRATVEIQFS